MNSIYINALEEINREVRYADRENYPVLPEYGKLVSCLELMRKHEDWADMHRALFWAFVRDAMFSADNGLLVVTVKYVAGRIQKQEKDIMGGQ